MAYLQASVQIDDDLSNLDNLINLQFHSLVPTMDPLPASFSITPSTVITPHASTHETSNDETSMPENICKLK